MKKTLSFILILLSGMATAQDSVSVKTSDAAEKKYTHEINFNGTFLVKQLFSNNPTATLPQLPYLANYTLGFGKKLGLRFGLGFEQSVSKTSIQGQIAPRTTTLLTGSYRLDLCKQIFSYKKFSAGMFVGAIADHAKLESSTVTDQGSGGTVKSDLTNKATGFGGEVGMGLKYSFNKHIGLWLEIPLQCKYSATKELDSQTFTSSFSTNVTHTISTGSVVSTKIFLPTSLFICVNF